MAGMKEIKNRISSVQDTQKITSAMYLISSAKLQKAKGDLDRSKPHFDALHTQIKKIFSSTADIESPYFYPKEGSSVLSVGKYAVLAITADKGLAGAYNKNIIKETEAMLEMHPDTDLYVVGEYGRHYFTRRNVKIKKSFLYTAQNPTLPRARDIAFTLTSGFRAGTYKKVFIVYTDMEKGMAETVENLRILPFHRATFYEEHGEKVATDRFEYYPDLHTVLENAVFSYVTGLIYGALVDSFCCEQSARMSAMNAANNNAEELLSDLKLEYNRKRQAAITQEITEVSAGAKAQKNKRKKR